ncbi:MAG TPA: polysaccharide deacetylase family protein [Chthonomonadales bacterium]|nr:polysaccharide deacetylase family protein [Chthonomonadales bacterium]
MDTRQSNSETEQRVKTLPPPPVFYDEERTRWRWFLRIFVPVAFLAATAFLLLIVSLLALPLMPRTMLPRVAPSRNVSNMQPLLTDHERRQMGYKQAKEKGRLRQLMAVQRRKRVERRKRAAAFVRRHLPPVPLPALPAAALQPPPPLPPAPVPINAPPVVAGFYVNWEETSRASTHRNIRALTHFIPEWLHLRPAGYNFADPSPLHQPFIDARELNLDKNDITPFVRSHNVPILPLINNYTEPVGATEGSGDWDPKALHQLVSDAKATTAFIAHLRRWLVADNMQGINVDFEEVNAADRNNLVHFMKELYSALHPYHLLVTQDVQLDADGFDIPRLAQWNDWIVPMFYDEYASGTLPGPVAGIGWTRSMLMQLVKSVPASKVVMGVGNHGYDWLAGTTSTDDVTYGSAMIIAQESQPDAVPHLDESTLNPTFSYAETATDSHNVQHEQDHVVWFQDAVSVYNQLQLAKPLRLRGGALWFLGSEDPSIWTFFNRSLWSANWQSLVTAGALDTVSYGRQAEVDFESDGELLQAMMPPQRGSRTVRLDPHSGLITAESYVRNPETHALELPSSYVVRRYAGTEGNTRKQIVLTFDDGPDPDWTPRILDILKKYHVPAVFFVVGHEAEAYPYLVRREFDEGHLIGNHSLTHPDLFRLPLEAQRLQLTTTQRIIQSIVERSTILFRPPYGGDTEPQTAREVEPLQVAADLGYLSVGERNDPQDWRLYDLKPGTEAENKSRPRDYRDIVQSVVSNRDVGSIVLLHDAGGDRSRTVAALPEIITQLRALGYHFVSLSDLTGFPRDKLMPALTGRDTLLIGADHYIFEFTYLVQRTLSTLFVLSLALGFSRVALFVTLALVQRVREKRRRFQTGFLPSVSVVIAAFNEEKVIVNTVRALLKSNVPELEIIVVDDGSWDATYDVAAEAFRSEPRVRLYRKHNGGKASALNVGLLEATGEVLVSLDADTLFTADTIRMLIRHFADPQVGAVSGNVRVGNARNLLTRWQSLEYITSQNFDRRGYDLLNCITVVPGAVGALRRSAVVSVGGYTSDTLAEDTDLTWKLRRAGWRIVNDNSAMAYTEAPEKLSALARQRFRWAYGTLQCLWKHRAALGQDGAFGWIALPSLWLYQILFPAISPFMDVAMAYSIFAGDFAAFALYYVIIFLVELVAATIAVRMDRADMRLLPWLFLQRFLYRQLMYYVVLRSLVAALRGSAVGWNKLERTGSARIEGAA